MAYSFIQVLDAGATSSASLITLAVTLTANSRCTAVAMYANGSDLVTTIVDTNGNTWTKIGAGYASAGGMFYSPFECKNVTVAGATTLTVNLSGAATQRGIA